ncbi:MAG: CBS domain-containing protein [Alphaproteobacteria bacterium]|uniref:CBS domain-containing protein n=1 Tax=Candidatus Nitrobium versatile TaxID=2884831 RepID=A0A953J6N4_9BACT|nr:CBS domain-containing protein [Candidatus Nitrobium versatile]
MTNEQDEQKMDRCEIGDEDLRAALREMKSYVDITEEDLKKIYSIALRHARERLSRKISVEEVMTREVISIKGDADIHKVSSLLAQHRISGLPVVDEENRVIGVVTEADVLSMAGVGRGHTFKDIVRHILGEPLPKHTVSACLVKEVMTSPAITTTPDADIKDVAAILNGKRIKRLPVVDSRGTLIGVISRADVVRVMGDTN